MAFKHTRCPIFQGADCDTDHYLVAAKVGDRVRVSKQAPQKINTNRFNLKKLNDWGVKEQFQVRNRNKFADLENLQDTNISALESLGYCESKNRKPWFDEECSKSADQRKQPKVQWLQEPSEVNEDNLSDVWQEVSRHFRNKKRVYLKDKINKLESNSKNQNTRVLYRGINEFKKVYQQRTNMVKDKRGNLLVDPHKILNTWKNYFCQLLNVHWEGGVRQTEMHTAEPFVPQPSASEVEAAIGKPERYKSPGVYQIQIEIIQAGRETLHSEIHKLIKLIWNKEELTHQWKESTVVLIHKNGHKTDCSNYQGIPLPSTSYKILSNTLLSRHQCGFQCNRSMTDQIFYIWQMLVKNWSIMVWHISYL
jgi:hypothetical protein